MTAILFLCVANSARSQMAEGIARRLLGPAVRVASAGSRPTAVSPYAVSVLAEIGIDISDQRAKGMDAVAADAFDVVVTLCGEAECPVLPAGVRQLHWPLDDPAAHPPNAPPETIRQRFRHARDAIVARLGGLTADMERGSVAAIARGADRRD
jgi:arsenate reductase